MLYFLEYILIQYFVSIYLFYTKYEIPNKQK